LTPSAIADVLPKVRNFLAKRVRLHFSDALDAFLSDPRIRGRLKPSTLPAYRTDLQAAVRLGYP
jgi:hypothetical protein